MISSSNSCVNEMNQGKSVMEVLIWIGLLLRSRQESAETEVPDKMQPSKFGRSERRNGQPDN